MPNAPDPAPYAVIAMQLTAQSVESALDRSTARAQMLRQIERVGGAIARPGYLSNNMAAAR